MSARVRVLIGLAGALVAWRSTGTGRVVDGEGRAALVDTAILLPHGHPDHPSGCALPTHPPARMTA